MTSHSAYAFSFSKLAETSPNPLSVDIESAEGIWILDRKGKRYMDLVSGISVNNLGHRHSAVLKAVTAQLDKYLHAMVYGEFNQVPQAALASALTALLPENLNTVFYSNSGSEAVEGAIKLARKYTDRTEVIAFRNAYHGSTCGALSLMGDEKLKNPFRPLLPDVRFIRFNCAEDLEKITVRTAVVIGETIQGEAGVIVPDKEYMKALGIRCGKTGALLALDEVQCGMGRTGKLFAFEHYGIVPDILMVAKAFGGGMPLGAFVSSKKIMNVLNEDPPLSHLTTFGGHPVSCAAGLAVLKEIARDEFLSRISGLEKRFRTGLTHPRIIGIRSKGLMMAVELESAELTKAVIRKCLRDGVITDCFLFNEKSLRISPPLTITGDEIDQACGMISEAIGKSSAGI